MVQEGKLMKTIKNRGAKHLGKILLTILLMLVPAGACALDTLHVEFMNVGKADAILIRTGDTTVVIDAATNSMGKEVAGRLAELGCDRIDDYTF